MRRRPGHPALGPRPLRTVAGALVGVAVLAAAAWRLEPGALAGALGACALPMVAAAAGLHAASSVAKAATWQALVNGLPSAAGRSRCHDLVPPLLVGALVNSVGVARAGDVAKIGLARRRLRRRGADVPTADLAGAMLAEHVVAMAAWGAVVVALTAGVAPPSVWAPAGLLGAGAAAVALATGAHAPRGGCAPAGGSRRSRLAAWGRRAWWAVHLSHRGLGRPGALARAAAAALAQWLLTWLAILSVLAGTGLGWVGPSGAALVLVGLTLAHAVPVTPGGLGVNQVGAVVPLVALGAPAEQAVAAALAVTASDTAVGVVLGAGCAMAEARTGRRPAPQAVTAP